MEQNKIGFIKRLEMLIKQAFNKLFNSHELFEEDIWQVRFSKLQQQHLRYTTEKSLFSLSVKSSDDIFKYLFLVMMAAMLAVMIFMSQKVGISTREIQQNEYSILVFDHIHHQGNPNAYKYHPYSGTQAQFIDLLIVSACKSMHIVDIFQIKHLISSIFGWLLIFYLSILLLKAFNWRTAFFTAFFLFISPRFVGYSLSNVVDVTFAFGFIFTITQMYYFCRELPVIRIYRLVKIILGTLLALSTYNAGFVLLHFLYIFTLLNFILYNPIHKFFTKEYLKTLGTLCMLLLGVTVLIYTTHALCTSFLTRSAVAPGRAFELLTLNYPIAQNQLFEGHLIGPDNFPHRYLSKYMFITIPTLVLIGFLMFFIFIKTAFKKLKPYSVFIFLYALLYCIHRAKSHYMNPDTMWAIYYIIYPLFMLIAASGIECTFSSINDRYTNFVVFCIIGLLSFMPIRHIAFNQPLTFLYYNEISGGIHNCYSKYELDCNDQINKSACNWLMDYVLKNDVRKHKDEDKIIVATNGNAACNNFFSDNNSYFNLIYKPYNEIDTTWDYYISFCNDIPAAQLRNSTWPPDSAFHNISIERKPIVAFYKNDYRIRQAAIRDSLEAVADSIAALDQTEINNKHAK